MELENKNNEVNSELSQLYEESISDIKEGQIIKGTIVQIGEKDILVDIGYKSEGVIYKSEVADPEDLKVGDEIDVMLEAKENDMGMVVLSHEKAKRLKGWQNIIDNYKEGDPIEGKVYKKVRGGFMVNVGMDAFLPASLSMMQEFGGPDNILGRKLEFKVVKINIPRKNIVLSRKEIVEEKRKDEKRAILESLNIGDHVKGIVRNITDFGAFVDIGGGITGLLHITDMSWGRVGHPSDIVKVGDEIEVKVLDFDKESVKVSLGLKQKTRNPWDDIDEKYTENSVIKGRVVNIMPYGVFVELEEGIEGLIHISEFSWSKKFTHPNEKFNLGDMVDAMVLRVDRENRKLSLGIKQMEKNPWDGVENRYSVGDRIDGTVTALTDYGAFVELDEGVEGLVHVSDLSWTKRVTHPREMLRKSDKVEAVVLSVDERNRRIALGIKQLGQDPWDEITKKYQSGTRCEGTVTNITNFGVFVELEKDLEGLLHISEMKLEKDQKMEDVYKPGDRINVEVIHIDGVQKKIALSQKNVENPAPDAGKGAEQEPAQEAGAPAEKAEVEPAAGEDAGQQAPASEGDKTPDSAEETPAEQPSSHNAGEEENTDKA